MSAYSVARDANMTLYSKVCVNVRHTAYNDRAVSNLVSITKDANNPMIQSKLEAIYVAGAKRGQTCASRD